MDREAIKDNKVQIKRLSSHEGFYNNVFKKIERILSVIIYILSQTKKGQVADTYIEMLKTRVFKTHETVLDTLKLQGHEEIEGLLDLQYDLLALDSTLSLAEATGLIPSDVNQLILSEIDSAQRYINNHFTQNAGYNLLDNQALSAPLRSTEKSHKPSSSQRRQQRVTIPSGDISSDAYMVHSSLTDRAERIKTVLEAKPQATIKDISQIITDVSEKTIQRELNSLIEKGQVLREGERRWSRYSVKK